MAIARGFGKLGMWSADGERRLGSMTDDFNRSLDEANEKWIQFEAKVRAGATAEIQPITSAIEAGTTILSNLDFSSQDAFINSISNLAGMAGPIGGWVGEALRAFNDFAKWLTRSMPAFTVQLQDYNYAYLHRWLSEKVLGLRSTSGERTLAYLYGMGWVPVFAGAGEFGRNSGMPIGDWGGDTGGVEADIEKFAIVAGPRSVPLGRVDSVPELASSEWARSPEGLASIAVGRALAQRLSPDGYDRIALQSELSGSHFAWKGQGLAFFHNIEYDLNPSAAGSYNVWLRGFIVNLAKLPNDILVPLANYIYLTIQASQTLEGLTPRVTEQVKKAAFGPNNEAFKRYNLTWILYQVLRRTPVAVAAVAEEGKRFRRIAARAKGAVRMEPEAPSTGPSPVVIAGGIGLAAIAAWFLLS